MEPGEIWKTLAAAPAGDFVWAVMADAALEAGYPAEMAEALRWAQREGKKPASYLGILWTWGSIDHTTTHALTGPVIAFVRDRHNQERRPFDRSQTRTRSGVWSSASFRTLEGAFEFIAPAFKEK